MKNLIDQLNESLGVNNQVNEANHKISSNDKDVCWPLTPAQNYMGEFGVIIGGTWSINNRGEMNKARTMIKALGLNIEYDIDDITRYGDNYTILWENGYAFVYFFSTISKEVNAYVFGGDGVEVIK